MEDKATLWRGPRVLQMREVDITLDNIARIFRVIPASLYLVSETGVVLVPSVTGFFGEVVVQDRYEVCGDETPAATASLPVPQPQPNLFRFGARPVASAGRSGPATAQAGRSFSRSISIGTVDGGILRADRGTLYVEFTEREANLATIAQKVKTDLGTDEEIVLCLGFWKQNARRIVALTHSSYNELMQRKRRRTGTAIRQSLRELGEYARANKINTVALTDDQVTTVRATFRCLICQDVMDNPVVAQCCRSVIGCRVCVDQWTATTPHCPKCRDVDFINRSFALTGMGDIIDALRDTIRN
ncbi:hypothetical protein VZT92_022682 [Zoarces viviparus]|uniref:RING-type domain-containing protein n=1 Tax=Zoarces viviparus TaxID=48416 RepID=A0AAW1EBE4_ZOAVI